MSCANDVVDGIVNVNRPTREPEPATILIMLFALVFMTKTRANKNKGFTIE